jgi:phage baseplate assembly protein W
MAFQVANKFPIDTKPRKAVGIKVPFSVPYVFEPTYTTKEAINVNLINFLLTNPGERYLNPQFGGGIRQQVFEQISAGNLDMLKLMLTNRIKSNFPMIDLAELKVLGNPDNNVVNVSITYNVVNFGITDNIDIIFTNG